VEIKTFQEKDLLVLERKVNDYIQKKKVVDQSYGIKTVKFPVEIISSYFTGRDHCIVLKIK